MRLHQEHLARLAMTRFGINEDVKKRVSTPMDTDFQGVPYDGVAKAADVQRMQNILGTLQHRYLFLTRRTIRQCANKLAKYAKNPSPSQLKAAGSVLFVYRHDQGRASRLLSHAMVHARWSYDAFKQDRC